MLARTTGTTANSVAYELEEITDTPHHSHTAPKRIAERLGNHGNRSYGQLSKQTLEERLYAAAERKKLLTAIRADKAREQVEKAKITHAHMKMYAKGKSRDPTCP